MAYKFRFSPSIKSLRHTSKIMLELGAALLAVLIFSLVFYTKEYGTNYALHILMMLAASLITAYIVEILFALVIKKDIKKHLASSYPYITSMIMVLICSVNVSIYPIIIGTIFAILFGKLVFGGFGQNIFNPAAVGRVVILSSFGGATVADLSTSATPISTIAAQGWGVAQGGFETFLEQFGGWTGLLTGWHAGAIGETSFALLLVIMIILGLRKVIDLRISLSYLISMVVISGLVALISGMDLSYALFHIVSGGAMFGAVFMLTDPVTSPVHPIGRVIFGIGAAILTIVIRLQANTPGGVVFAILLMNILVSLIDYVLQGNQIKTMKKAMIILASVSVLGLGIGALLGNAMEVPVEGETSAEIIDSSVDGDITSYTVTTDNFYGDDKNEFIIKINSSSNTIDSVEFSKFKDTEGVGDAANTPEYLGQYAGMDINSIEVDAQSGATFTSNYIKEAVNAAVAEFGGK